MELGNPNWVSMKTLILYLALVLMACGEKHKVNPGAVYICTGKYSKAYHSVNDCSGLDNCKGEIRTITLEEAQKMHRHGCSRCVGE